VHAACQVRGFVGVARLALDLGDVVWVRILLDVGMAVVALQAAVDACTELAAIDGDAVTCGVGHGFVTVAREAISLRSEAARSDKQRQPQKSKRCLVVISSYQLGQVFGWTEKDRE
jgi:hypothetical protein